MDPMGIWYLTNFLGQMDSCETSQSIKALRQDEEKLDVVFEVGFNVM